MFELACCCLWRRGRLRQSFVGTQVGSTLRGAGCSAMAGRVIFVDCWSPRTNTIGDPPKATWIWLETVQPWS